MGGRGTLDAFLATSGFKRNELKIVRRFADIAGYKDTIIFWLGDASWQTIPEIAAINDYAEQHNIKQVIL